MEDHGSSRNRNGSRRASSISCGRRNSQGCETRSPPNDAPCRGCASTSPTCSKARTEGRASPISSATRSQLVIYHFMFGADWDAGCKSCSFWADGLTASWSISRIATSPSWRSRALRSPARGVQKATWAGASNGCRRRAPTSTTTSTSPSRPRRSPAGRSSYNYGTQDFDGPELPGISVFCRDGDGAMFHTYSCYERGLDMMNTAYHYLDLVPKGRDEGTLPYPQAWVHLHDDYRD